MRLVAAAVAGSCAEDVVVILRAKLVTFLMVVVAVAAGAQFSDPPDVEYSNTPYNGRFTFVRVRYKPTRWGPGDYAWGLDLKWNHDYPRADKHFMKIIREVTSIDANEDGNIIALDDPELFRYPLTYMCEAGFLTLNEAETTNLRNYLLKGGFLVVDDFVGPQWRPFEREMAKVIPDGRWVLLDGSHPVFDAFFKVDPQSIHHPYPRMASGPPRYLGLFSSQKDDRMLVLANFDNDISEYWEFSDTGFAPIDLSNTAYKLGVNEIVYAMTH